MSDPVSLPRCPIDGGRMPLVGRHRRPGRQVVRLFWCPFCAAGIAVIGEDDSCKAAARFSLDDKTATLTVTGSLLRDDVNEAVAAFGRQLFDRLNGKS